MGGRRVQLSLVDRMGAQCVRRRYPTMVTRLLMASLCALSLEGQAKYQMQLGRCKRSRPWWRRAQGRASMGKVLDVSAAQAGLQLLQTGIWIPGDVGGEGILREGTEVAGGCW
jgi:hypothetical protein